MTVLILVLIFCQALGAFIGVSTAMWGEFAYIRAIRGGELAAASRAYLRIIGNGLRFGLTLSLLSSLSLVIISYTIHGALQPALTASYWIFIIFAFLVIGISWALSHRRISFELGSAAALTAWWLLAYLTLGRLPILFFSSAIALYVVLTGIVYVLLRYVRLFALRKR